MNCERGNERGAFAILSLFWCIMPNRKKNFRKSHMIFYSKIQKVAHNFLNASNIKCLLLDKEIFIIYIATICYVCIT